MQIGVKLVWYWLIFFLHCPSVYIYTLIWGNITRLDYNTKSISKEKTWLLHESYSNKYRKGNQHLSTSLSAAITMIFSSTYSPSACFPSSQASSVVVFKSSFIGIGNNISDLTSNASQSKSTFPSVTTIHRQQSSQANLHRHPSISVIQ
jgi:hypothetical protein